MKPLPNPTVQLVGADGRPSSSLLELMPGLSLLDVVADRRGLPTPLFLSKLRGISNGPVGNARAQLFNRDGTPTRLMTALLMGLP